MKRIGVLTSGGDAPGMNAAIRAVVRSGISAGTEVCGIWSGYTGLLEGNLLQLSASSVANTIQRGGTWLKTSRSDEFRTKAGRKKAAAVLESAGIEGLVVIGGDGSYRGALALHQEHGIHVVGVPGTIDNDIPGTDDTIGFDTAINTAVEMIDRIRDTASSHNRIFIVEVMGRASGNIALSVGLSCGAEFVMIPEVKTKIQDIHLGLQRSIARGKLSSILVAAEGSPLGGANEIAKKLKVLGHDAKVAILGHTQRGGSPTAHDRILASCMGQLAVESLLGGKPEGMIVSMKGEFKHTSLKALHAKTSTIAHAKRMEDLVRVLAI
jgi:6-phosphofructokinase 1